MNNMLKALTLMEIGRPLDFYLHAGISRLVDRMYVPSSPARRVVHKRDPSVSYLHFVLN